MLLFQVAFSYLLIGYSAGNGSFVGLGVMLLAVIGVPTTACANGVLIYCYRKRPVPGYVGRLLLLALLLPGAQLALLALVTTLRL